MERIVIIGKNETSMTLKNSEDLDKVYTLINDEENFIVFNDDYSEVFLTTKYSGKLKAGDFVLNARKKGAKK